MPPHARQAAGLTQEDSLVGKAARQEHKRLLDLTQNITTQKKRVDLVELLATGTSNSVSQAKLGLQLWSQENGRVP